MVIKKTNKKALFRETPIGYEFFAVNRWVDKEGNVCYDTGVSIDTEGGVVLLIPPVGIDRKQLIMNPTVIESGNLVVSYKRLTPYYKINFEPPEFGLNDCVGRLIVLK